MAVINSSQNPFDDLYILLILCFNHIMMEVFMFLFLQLRKLLRIWTIKPDTNSDSNEKQKTSRENKLSTKENLRIDSFSKIEKIRKYKNKIGLFLNKLKINNFSDEKYQKEFLYKNKSKLGGV
jgi:hypothetical protein